LVFAAVFPRHTVLTALIQNWTIKEKATSREVWKVSEPPEKLLHDFSKRRIHVEKSGK
jgi:hypothetical protein